MGLLGRMSTIFKAKVNRALDKAENPGETLDYSYERQLTQIQNFKRGIVEVTTAKKRLELQSSQLKSDIDRIDVQARQALAANREDLARTVLLRKQTAQQQLDQLDPQIAQLNDQQQKLSDAEMTKLLTDGKGKMPKSKLPADDIKAVIAFVRSLKK